MSSRIKHLKRRKNKVDSPKYSFPSEDQHSFDDLVSLFLLDCRARNLSNRTLQFYEENLRLFERAFLDQNLTLDVLTITYQDIKYHFIGYMLDRGLAPHIINCRIKSCKAFFKFLFHSGWRDHNLAEQLEVVKTENHMIQTFTKSQAVRLLNEPDRSTFVGFRDYTMMLLLLETGMRISEMLSLKVGDVIFQENEIRIHDGKGRKARRVPFQKTCARILKKYIFERGNLETDALFVTVDNTPIHHRTIQQNIQNYGRLAQITGVRISPHTFRHTMAKFYILNGGDPFTLQQILGHSSLDIVRQYVQLFRTDIQEQHQKYSPVENITLRQNTR